MIDLIEPTRSEVGCVSYNLNISLDNSNTFTMIEYFKDQEAFDSHLKEPYIRYFKEKILVELVDESAISVGLYKALN